MPELPLTPVEAAEFLRRQGAKVVRRSFYGYSVQTRKRSKPHPMSAERLLEFAKSRGFVTPKGDEDGAG